MAFSDSKQSIGRDSSLASDELNARFSDSTADMRVATGLSSDSSEICVNDEHRDDFLDLGNIFKLERRLTPSSVNLSGSPHPSPSSKGNAEDDDDDATGSICGVL
jgi:hypothetical protein